MHNSFPPLCSSWMTGRPSVLLVDEPASFTGNISWAHVFSLSLCVCLSVCDARAHTWKSKHSFQLLISSEASREGPLRSTYKKENTQWMREIKNSNSADWAHPPFVHLKPINTEHVKPENKKKDWISGTKLEIDPQMHRHAAISMPSLVLGCEWTCMT